MTEASPTVEDAAARLSRGRLVAFPTETVYGLGADALNPEAVRSVFRLKGRPSDNPLIVHVGSPEGVGPLARRVDDRARALMDRFWPGPLTLVLERSERVPDVVCAGASTVALRCPDHPLALRLLEAFGGPLVGPSANPSGHLSPTNADHVREGFADAIARDELVVLDGGPCTGGIESTVLALLPDRPPTILRPGLIGPEEISKALRGVDVVRGGSGTIPSPGTRHTHYRPGAPVQLVGAARVGELAASVEGRVAALVISADDLPGPHLTIRMPDVGAPYASRLYAAVREADSVEPAAILIETPPRTSPVWDAVADRLRRMASGE